MDTSPPSSDPFHGLNPADLMAAAAMPTDGGADTLPLTRADLPSLAEIAAAFPELEILELIGHGGMSAVFKARQPRLDRLVALKVLPKSLAATPGFAERFTREGRVLARLSHPSIVAVHDFGESGGFFHLIMEYVDGVNLRQAMRAGRFTPEQALGIIPVMCEALQYAHSQGVLHRDIKPENVLLDAKGRVKIADFGIAKILDENADGGMLLTQSGARLGTAPYMAPEQIEKPGSVDHRADIYSLGVVFYEMLTGELPLGRFAAPSEKAAVSGGMDEVVFRALAKERERRQQSAGEFKTQIEGVAALPPHVQRSMEWQLQSFEYKSKRTLLGLPLVHVTRGIDPATGQKRTARGFFAFGDKAVGVVAFGGYARGLFACGGMSVGVVAIGGMAVGLVCWGGLALAWLLAYGGIAAGFFAAGGLALGWEGVGGIVACVHGYGGQVYAFAAGMGAHVHAPYVADNLAVMPGPLQWLVKMTRVTGPFVAWIWAPLMLPSLLMPWWARRQLEFETQEKDRGATSWYERPSRVLWLLPGMLLLFGVVMWTFSHWLHAGKAGVTAQTVVASAIVAAGLLLAGLSLPLWLRLVPMNSIFGVRLPSTLASTTRWYEVNAVFGRNLLGWSLTVIAAGIAGFYQLPRHQDAYAWAAFTLMLVAAAASTISTLVWMRRHPVGRPAIKPHRLVKNIEVAIPIIVLMFFIRAFIGASYSIPHDREPGVAKGSRWLASKLNTGFAPGDLIAYAHESGQTWLARVVAVEPKGLLLKRGGSAEEFPMPWDKIIGKMLFPYWPVGRIKVRADAAQKVPDAAPPPVVDGTAHALDQKPVLRFVRLQRNQKSWAWPLYSPGGKPLDDEESRRLVTASSGDALCSAGAEDCWLQMWFDHPDFDPYSLVGVEISDANGLQLKDRDGSLMGPGNGMLNEHHPLMWYVLSPGRVGRLPSEIQITLRYAIGPWQPGNVIPSTWQGAMWLGKDCMLAGPGDDSRHQAFVSWSMASYDTLYDAVARLKNGSSTGSLDLSWAGNGGNMVQRRRFRVSLSEVESFQFRSRKIQSVTFPHVKIPPLP